MMGNRDRELAILQSRLFLELRRNGAACAHCVFDHHALPQGLAHGDGHQARDHVCGATSRKGNDQRNRLVREAVLRLRAQG